MGPTTKGDMEWREKANLMFYRRVYSRYKHVRGMNWLKRRINEFSLRRYQDVHGTPLTDMGWDHTIILDACRHDLYEEVNGSTEYRYSAEPATPKYIATNFEEKQEDIVYLTGHPRLTDTKLEDNIGKTDICHERILIDSIEPKELVQAVEEARDKYPDKRMIIHFMPPHVPFQGHDWPEDIKERLDRGKTSENQLAASGIITPEQYWTAYRDNLAYVMPYVEETIDMLTGTIVITGDHANLVGEGGIFGHPFDHHPEPLKKVPYDVREREERKSTLDQIEV